MLDSVLVANRGGIARRIIRCCRKLGVRSVAVYSEADAGWPHVSEADEAVLVGPAPARESYLSIDRMLAVARQSGARAIHPGYGFLSENWRFAQACEEAGLVFVGPPWRVMQQMGDKIGARRLMLWAGVPVRDRGTWRCKSSATVTVTWCILASASARYSGGTRSWWKRALPPRYRRACVPGSPRPR